MKTNYFKPIMNVMLASLFLVAIACSKDEDPIITEPDQTEQTPGELTNSNGITEGDLEAHQGSIGIIIDTRDIAQMGFLPVMAEIEVDASENDYSRALEVDEFTNLATLEFDVENLSDAALKELKDGVPITVGVKDKDGTILVTQEFSVVSFRENGTFVNVNADELNAIEKPISFNPDIPYYIQLIEGGVLSNRTFDLFDDTLNSEEIQAVLFNENTFDSSNNAKSQFHLLPVPEKESTFYIASLSTNTYMKLDQIVYFEEILNPSELTMNHEFIMEISETGNIYIKHSNQDYIYRLLENPETPENSLYNVPWALDMSDFLGPTEIAEFRIIPATIQWEIEALNTVFMKPILPAVETSFGFNSTLVNCSQGTLEQEVGTEINEETTTIVGWEESVELSSESTYEASATVSVTASAKFFGAGVEATASATTGYSSTSGFTHGHTGFAEHEKTTSQTFFSSRTIEVLPGTAVLVYDAYQTYSNVLVPFVQRFRVRGSDSNNNSTLTGDDIVSQFSFNNFNGVITKVGVDFVEVTVRGTVTLDNLIDTQSQVQEVESGCN